MFDCCLSAKTGESPSFTTQDFKELCEPNDVTVVQWLHIITNKFSQVQQLATNPNDIVKTKIFWSTVTVFLKEVSDLALKISDRITGRELSMIKHTC
jgi:hypothetical protein